VEYELSTNGLDREFGCAGLAIDAFICVDEKELLVLLKTFDGTDHYAVCAFAIETRFGNHLSHYFAIRWCELIVPQQQPALSTTGRLVA